MKRFVTIIVVSLLLLSAGCASVQSVKDGRGNGTIRKYPGACSDQWKKSIETVHRLGLEILEMDQSTFTIIAKTSISGFSWGERVGIWLTQGSDKASCEIEVYSRRVGSLNVTGEDWEPHFFKLYDAD